MADTDVTPAEAAALARAAGYSDTVYQEGANELGLRGDGYLKNFPGGLNDLGRLAAMVARMGAWVAGAVTTLTGLSDTATQKATIATTKAGEAAASATTAGDKATIATTKAGEAAASATTAGDKATIATTKAGEAVAAADRAATFDPLLYLKLVGGGLTGWLQTHAGVDASNLGLRIGEATSGWYRSGAGVLGFVAGGVDVFRTAASGVLTFRRAVRGTPVAVTDAATVTLDFNAANQFDWTVGGNRVLGNPSNLAAGQGGRIVVRWTAANTIGFGNYWKPAGTQSWEAGAGKVNRLQYDVVSATEIHFVILKGF